MQGQNGPLALIFEIFGPETLFGKYIGKYHFLWYSSLVSSSTPFLFSTMAPDVGIWNFKKSLVPELMKPEYCSATLSPYYPTLKPSVTHNTQPSIEQNKPINTKPLKVSSPSPLPEHSLTLTLTYT